MSVEEYISSGILELYVLGDLPAGEEEEVLRMSKEHPEISEEIQRIELAMEQTAFQMAVNPPSQVKERILRQVDGRADERPVVTIAAASSNYKYFTAASLILAIVSGVLAYNYYQKWQNAEGELTALVAQNQQIAEDYSTVKAELETAEKDFQIINSPDYQRVVMEGTDNAPQALAYVYWNEKSEEVYLSAKSLEPLPDEQQYQLWAIVDGQPVDAGVFDLGSPDLLLMKDISPPASAFAITVESRGGSSSPTLETMQVIGNV